MVGYSPLISDHVQKIDLKQTASEYETQTRDFRLKVNNSNKKEEESRNISHQKHTGNFNVFKRVHTVYPYFKKCTHCTIL